jgi:hypothetical protein
LKLLVRFPSSPFVIEAIESIETTQKEHVEDDTKERKKITERSLENKDGIKVRWANEII